MEEYTEVLMGKFDRPYYGFPLEFYFRGHMAPLTLILRDIWGDWGTYKLEHIRNISILGDMYVSLSNILGDIWTKKWQNLAFLRARENPTRTIPSKIGKTEVPRPLIFTRYNSKKKKKKKKDYKPIIYC